MAKCGNCGIVFGQQLSFGLSDDEVEDEEYEDGVIEVECILWAQRTDCGS